MLTQYQSLLKKYRSVCAASANANAAPREQTPADEQKIKPRTVEVGSS